MRARTHAGRDIGELPKVDKRGSQKIARRETSDTSVRPTFHLRFHLAWSPDHIKVIEKIEQAVCACGFVCTRDGSW